MVVRAWYRMLCWAGSCRGRAVFHVRTGRFDVRCPVCHRQMPGWRATVRVIDVNNALDREVGRWWARVTGSDTTDVFLKEMMQHGRG